MELTRRSLLKSGTAAGLGIALSGSLDAVFGPAAFAGSRSSAGFGPYGELLPDPRGLLDLPRGFRYEVLSRTGDPITTDGVPGRMPGRFDGQATFRTRRQRTVLVRNHEQTDTADAQYGGTSAVTSAPPELVFDPAAFGGTTNLVLGPDLRREDEYVSLAGSSTNCAGGRTPWGTWLTCEETELRAGQRGFTKDHGWVFEVDPEGNERNCDPFPLRAMGRFPHEAVAVDPRSNVVYLTEDAARPFGLVYRFTPQDASGGYGGYREGGLLEALRVPGVPDLSAVQTPGAVLRGVQWRRVPDPLAATVSTRKQFADTEVTRSQKLEGMWWADGYAYVVASFARTSSGAAFSHNGQVWRYSPDDRSLELVLVFSAAQDSYDSPDNITVSPYGGGVVLAEDGDGEQYLVGATPLGEPFTIARNRIDTADPPDPSSPEPPVAEYSEFAGVTFSDDGRVLFANVQTPGITFAISGPWKRRDDAQKD